MVRFLSRSMCVGLQRLVETVPYIRITLHTKNSIFGTRYDYFDVEMESMKSNFDFVSIVSTPSDLLREQSKLAAKKLQKAKNVCFINNFL